MSISALNGAAAPHAHRAHHHHGAKGASNDQDQTAAPTATTAAATDDPFADPDDITALLSPVTSSSTAVQSALNSLKLGGE